MRIIALSEDSFRNLIITGSPYYPLENYPDIKEKDDEEAITLMIGMAQNKPEFFIEILREANIYGEINGMSAVALAVFLACAHDYIKQNSLTKSYISKLLGSFKPEDLFVVVELLRSKYFGKGLGSFEQKLIRNVMEGWSYETIQNHLEKDSINFKSLLRIIHPRYTDGRGKLIKNSK